MADEVLGPEVRLAERVKLVDQPFRANPAQRVLGDVALVGAVRGPGPRSSEPHPGRPGKWRFSFSEAAIPFQKPLLGPGVFLRTAWPRLLPRVAETLIRQGTIVVTMIEVLSRGG